MIDDLIEFGFDFRPLAIPDGFDQKIAQGSLRECLTQDVEHLPA